MKDTKELILDDDQKTVLSYLEDQGEGTNTLPVEMKQKCPTLGALASGSIDFGDNLVGERLKACIMELAGFISRKNQNSGPIYFDLIRKLIEYNWEDERKDYQACDEDARKHHIFEVLVDLDNLVNNRRETPTEYIDI